MKTEYTAATEFTHRGVLVPAGGTVRLTDIEAKYLKHALVPPDDGAADARRKLVSVIAAKPEPAPAKKPARRRSKRVNGNGEKG